MYNYSRHFFKILTLCINLEYEQVFAFRYFFANQSLNCSNSIIELDLSNGTDFNINENLKQNHI